MRIRSHADPDPQPDPSSLDSQYFYLFVARISPLFVDFRIWKHFKFKHDWMCRWERRRRPKSCMWPWPATVGWRVPYTPASARPSGTKPVFIHQSRRCGHEQRPGLAGAVHSSICKAIRYKTCFYSSVSQMWPWPATVGWRGPFTPASARPSGTKPVFIHQSRRCGHDQRPWAGGGRTLQHLQGHQVQRLLLFSILTDQSPQFPSRIRILPF